MSRRSKREQERTKARRGDRLRRGSVVALAVGIIATAGLPSYAVSPAVASTVNLSGADVTDLAQQELRLAYQQALQSGDTLQISDGGFDMAGGLSASTLATAHLSQGNVCVVSENQASQDTEAVIPVPEGSYTISSRLGVRWGRMHAGVDLAGPIGTSIVAALSGKVVGVGVTAGSPYVQIHSEWTDGTPIETMYLHMPLSSVIPKVGDTVRAGDPIATIGNEGRSTGPHLHFELHPNAGTGDSIPDASTAIDGIVWLQDHGAKTTPGCSR